MRGAPRPERPAGCRFRRRGRPARPARRAAPRRAAPRHRQGPRPATTRSSGSRSRATVAAPHRPRRRPAPTSWRGLVRNHLLLADTATRRDLGDARTISRFADAVGDTERNALLYALTIGDSRATGPAAWNSSKASLVRSSTSRRTPCLRAVRQPTSRPSPTPTATWPRGGRGGRRRRVPRRDAGVLRARVRCAGAGTTPRPPARPGAGRRLGGSSPDDLWRCTIVAPDRTGLLATAAAALALVGFDIERAVVASHPSGYRARGVHRPRPLRAAGLARRPGTRHRRPSRAALDGTVALDQELRERSRRYRPATPTVDRDVRVLVDTDASDARDRRRGARPRRRRAARARRGGVRRPGSRRRSGDRRDRRRPRGRRLLPRRRYRARASPAATRSRHSGRRC